MSVNNVFLHENYLELIEDRRTSFLLSSDGTEVIRYASATSRQSLSIKQKLTPNSKGLHLTAADGYVFITTKRFIYVTKSQGDILSFSIDLTMSPSIQFSHDIKSPWFGANYWKFMFYSTTVPDFASDGFPKNEWYEGKLYFNEGGLFEFAAIFNSALNDAVNNSHIDDELPSYSEI